MKQVCPYCRRRVEVSGLGIPNVTPWLRRHLIGKTGRRKKATQTSRTECEGSFLATGSAAFELAYQTGQIA